MYRRRNNTQKIQKHGVHKIENKHTKPENRHKKYIKKTVSRLIRKQQRETNNNAVIS
jgi:hypothetical protein